MIKNQSNLIKVAVFSDLHVDYNYTAGTNSNCGRLICCRDGEPTSAENTANEWGNKMCDLPEATMLNMFEFIDQEIKPDFVIWGGGSVPSDFDEQTNFTNIETMKKVSQQVFDNLGHKYQVFPNIGNTDTYPFSNFDANNAHGNSVINAWSGEWDRFLTKRQAQTFKNFGYYSA